MVEDISGMVDIPDTKGFVVKTSAERFKQCPLPYWKETAGEDGGIRSVLRH